MTDLLEIRDLAVQFESDTGDIKAVDHINLTIRRGEVVGLVGESGSGKSVTSVAILRLIRRPGRVTSGTITFDGVDLASLTEEAMRQVRGAKIALVSQSPRTALNPVISIGRQISRLFQLHAGWDMRLHLAFRALHRHGVALYIKLHPLRERNRFLSDTRHVS